MTSSRYSSNPPRQHWCCSFSAHAGKLTRTASDDLMEIDMTDHAILQRACMSLENLMSAVTNHGFQKMSGSPVGWKLIGGLPAALNRQITNELWNRGDAIEDIVVSVDSGSMQLTADSVACRLPYLRVARAIVSESTRANFDGGRAPNLLPTIVADQVACPQGRERSSVLCATFSTRPCLLSHLRSRSRLAQRQESWPQPPPPLKMKAGSPRSLIDSCTTAKQCTLFLPSSNSSTVCLLCVALQNQGANF